MASTQCGWASGFKSLLRNWRSERARTDGCGSAWQECMEQTKPPFNDQGEHVYSESKIKRGTTGRHIIGGHQSIKVKKKIINLLFLFYTGCVTSTIVSHDGWVVCTICFSSLRWSFSSPHFVWTDSEIQNRIKGILTNHHAVISYELKSPARPCCSKWGRLC